MSIKRPAHGGLVSFLCLLPAIGFAQSALLVPLAPDARAGHVEWRYTTELQADGWAAPGFDDAAWLAGPGGFGNQSAGDGPVATAWEGSDIFLRRTFTVADTAFADLVLSLQHDDDVQVYLNGELIHSHAGFQLGYSETTLQAAAKALLRPGVNLLAVHCMNVGAGPQYVDAGLLGSRASSQSALSPDARSQAVTWSYTFADPGAGWETEAFDASAWQSGPGGFGTAYMDGMAPGTLWETADIWMRRSVEATQEHALYKLTFAHDDRITVYVNGRQVLAADGFSSGYREKFLTAEELGLKPGPNTLAVHCANVGGPQYADIGIYGLGADPVSLAPRQGPPALLPRAATLRAGPEIVFRKGSARFDPAGRRR